MAEIVCTFFLCVCVCEQEVEYVKEEAKMVYLLECLQKTTPPVSTTTCCLVFKNINQTCQE